MKTKKILITISLVLVLITLSNCFPHSMERKWKNTYLIFIGTVTGETNPPVNNLYGQPVLYENIVTNEVFKGVMSVGDTITIFENVANSYKFNKGGQYIIFANMHKGFLNATLHNGTCPIKEAKEILEFLAKKPKEMYSNVDEVVEESI